jgi:hypothetical protein
MDEQKRRNTRQAGRARFCSFRRAAPRTDAKVALARNGVLEVIDIPRGVATRLSNDVANIPPRLGLRTARESPSRARVGSATPFVNLKNASGWEQKPP